MKPWEHDELIWKTKASFFSFLRSGFRRMWVRHPSRNILMRQLRKRKAIGRNGREIWSIKCQMCEDWLPQNKVQMDHKIPAGSLRTEEDIQSFVERLLFVTPDDLRPLCHSCHQLVTLAERLNISIKEARIQQLAIAFTKFKVADQKAMLKMWGVPEQEHANTKKRRHAAEQFYTQEAQYDEGDNT